MAVQRLDVVQVVADDDDDVAQVVVDVIGDSHPEQRAIRYQLHRSKITITKGFTLQSLNIVVTISVMLAF